MVTVIKEGAYFDHGRLISPAEGNSIGLSPEHGRTNTMAYHI